MSAKFSKEKFDPVEFKPREASREDWGLLHDYRRIRHAEIRPDDPITPEEQAEASMKYESPHGLQRYFVLKDGGRFISVLGGSVLKPESPGYEENKHVLFAGGSVVPEMRRRGIGAMWLPIVSRLMEEYANTVLTVSVEQESGHGFMKWLGAEEKLSGAENRLDFTEVDWEMVNRWVAEGEERGAGGRLEFYERRLPDSILDEYSPVYEACMNMAPREGLDMGDVRMTREGWADMYRQADELGTDHHTYMSREVDGRISGLTEIYYNPKKPGYMTQELTGVLPEFRGRGTGKWLKAAMLLYIRGRYPDTKWIVTGNAGSNAPMLAINYALGFKEYKAGSAYQIGKEKLDARLAELGL